MKMYENRIFYFIIPPAFMISLFFPIKISIKFRDSGTIGPEHLTKISLFYYLFWSRYVTCPIALCMIFTILLTLRNSEQKNGLLIKLFCFSSDFDETWWSCSYPCVLQFHQVSSKSEEKQKSFINSPYFCSSVSRIVKIVQNFSMGKSYYFSLDYDDEW